MNKVTGGVIIVVCLTATGVTAILTGTNGTILAGTIGTITLIAGSILGFEIGLKKSK